MNAEEKRLEESRKRKVHWKRWGPYLSERQWGTVREDYSPDGTAWEFFPHDHARSRAYRWGEDGIMGISDRHQLVCFALALWNGRDPILKERLFGLTGNEGNHGEDVKEYYFYLDSTPTHLYMKALYKYPQVEFPYGKLVEENRRRNRSDFEYELMILGTKDPHVPDAGRETIDRAPRRSGARYTMLLYPTEHAFTRDEGPRFDPETTDLAFAEMIRLFRNVFRD